METLITSVWSKLRFLAISMVMGLGIIGPSWAADFTPKAYSLPEPATPLAEEMRNFHNYWLTPVIFIVAIFVLLLLIYVCYKFAASRHPVPTKTTHNPLLEVIWTGVPVLILVVLAFPSLKLLYNTDKTGDADMTLKITGHQWYWQYEYVDEKFGFDAMLVARTQEEATAQNVKRLIDTDNVVVLPVNTKIRLQMTSTDVIHNWAVSDFGVRVDTVPGRLNEAWMLANRTGQFYGFCSELCGVDHAYMPISVKIVSKEEYAEWLKTAKAKFASGATPTIPATQIASNP